MKSRYRMTRDLHMYAGLFVSPFILAYAVSVVLLNHAWEPESRVTAVRTAPVSVVMMDDGLELAKAIRAELGLSGEIGYVNRNEREQTVFSPIEMPGEKTTVRVDLKTRTAQLETTRLGVGDALNFAHRMPGPHNVAIRGNWLFMNAWSWLADGTVYLLLFVTTSGVFLWAVVRADRRAGLVMLGLGVASFTFLLLGLVA